MTSPEAQPEPRRLQIRGIHHITMIVGSLERSTSFYRDVLGLRLVKQTLNQDDPNSRHFFLGDAEGSPGTLVSFMEYPQMEEGTVGRGSTHHFALHVDSAEELEGWRGYLSSRGIPCTEVLDRVYFKSIYLRDPDGHIIELATGAPGFTVDEPLDQLGSRLIPPP